MNELKSAKAIGGCGIYAEILKSWEATTLLWLHTSLCSGTRGSSRPRDEALSFRSGRERVTPGM